MGTLLAAHTPDMAFLDGVRVLANLWVILLHCWEMWSLRLAYETLARLGNSRWLPW
jgi:hypothetical protein